MSASGESVLGRISRYLPSQFSLAGFTWSPNHVPASSGWGGGAGCSSASSAADAKQRTYRRACVCFKQFQRIYDPETDIHHLFLVLGLVDGFQVFKVFGSQVQLLLAVRDGPIASASLLLAPRLEQSRHGLAQATNVKNQGAGQQNDSACENGFESRVLLAVRSATDARDFPRSLVKLYDVSQRRYTHVRRFPDVVRGISTSHSGRFVVSLENELHVFRLLQDEDGSVSMELCFAARCFPNPPHRTVFALGSRWLAYAGGQPIMQRPSPSLSPSVAPSHKSPSMSPLLAANGHSGLPPPMSLTPAAPPEDVTLASTIQSSLSNGGETVANVAKNVASGLYNVGQKGTRMLLSKIASSHQDQSELHSLGLGAIDNSDRDAAARMAPFRGTIIIRDIVTQRIISHFKAHSAGISCMAFDDSGMLLVTADEVGQYLHVYQIITTRASPAVRRTHHARVFTNGGRSQLPTHRTRLLYRLFRGITHSSIRSLSFSSDSRWLVVTSGKGTCHLFAINPDGGPIGIDSHGPLLSDITDQQDDWSVDRFMMPRGRVVQEFCERGPIIVSAVHRIRLAGGGTAVRRGHESSYDPMIASFHALINNEPTHAVSNGNGIPTRATDQLLVVNGMEVLAMFQPRTLVERKHDSSKISPVTSYGPNSVSFKLKLDVAQLSQWDLSGVEHSSGSPTVANSFQIPDVQVAAAAAALEEALSIEQNDPVEVDPTDALFKENNDFKASSSMSPAKPSVPSASEGDQNISATALAAPKSRYNEDNASLLSQFESTTFDERMDVPLWACPYLSFSRYRKPISNSGAASVPVTDDSRGQRVSQMYMDDKLPGITIPIEKFGFYRGISVPEGSAVQDVERSIVEAVANPMSGNVHAAASAKENGIENAISLVIQENHFAA